MLIWNCNTRALIEPDGPGGSGAQATRRGPAVSGIMPTGRPSWPMIVATVVPAQMNAVI